MLLIRGRLLLLLVGVGTPVTHHPEAVTQSELPVLSELT